jgi:hypothetical protein
MLSTRGQANADQLDIPWRFAKGTTYDSVTNPEGLISFGTAENALMQRELEEFANNVMRFPILLYVSFAPTRALYCSQDITICKHNSRTAFSLLNRFTSQVMHSAMHTAPQADRAFPQDLQNTSTSTFLRTPRSLATISKFQQQQHRSITSSHTHFAHLAKPS